MSKLTEAARILSTTLTDLNTQVQNIAQRQRVRKTTQTLTLANARASLPALLELVDVLEGNVTKKAKVVPARGINATPSPVTHVPYTTEDAVSEFVLANTAGTTKVKNQPAVNLVVLTPTVGIFGRQPLEYTLATGEKVKISGFARGTRVDLGDGYSLLAVLNRFLAFPRPAGDTQAVLNKLQLAVK